MERSSAINMSQPISYEELQIFHRLVVTSSFKMSKATFVKANTLLLGHIDFIVSGTYEICEFLTEAELCEIISALRSSERRALPFGVDYDEAVDKFFQIFEDHTCYRFPLVHPRLRTVNTACDVLLRSKEIPERQKQELIAALLSTTQPSITDKLNTL